MSAAAFVNIGLIDLPDSMFFLTASSVSGKKNSNFPRIISLCIILPNRPKRKTDLVFTQALTWLNRYDLSS